MYNLLVSCDLEAWDKDLFVFEEERCIKIGEYSTDEIVKKYGELNGVTINEIKRFPCIFAYEKSFKKDPKFGFITEIVKRQGKIGIRYKIVNLENFLTYLDIQEILFNLDTSDAEMNRTHWAIKDIDLAKELAVKDIVLPNNSLKKIVDIANHQFDVALSFPGEFREYVKKVAAKLEITIGHNACFYDDNYKAQLARPSLDILLQKIYEQQSRLIVVFLGEKYQEKEWCGIEFRAIRPLIKQREHEKVMYVKMDDGKVDGVFGIDGYINGSTHSPEEVAGLIKERIELIKSKEGIQNKKVVSKILKNNSFSKDFHNPAFNGVVTFDYSNNNGYFTIGEGEFLFETRWSKASNTSIYAYTYSPSIECLALYKGSNPIEKIGDIAELDYSSPVRSPSIGQTVIWQNANGFYAATRIRDIKDDTRSSDRDEVTFEYVIKSDGTTFF